MYNQTAIYAAMLAPHVIAFILLIVVAARGTNKNPGRKQSTPGPTS